MPRCETLVGKIFDPASEVQAVLKLLREYGNELECRSHMDVNGYFSVCQRKVKFTAE